MTPYQQILNILTEKTNNKLQAWIALDSNDKSLPEKIQKHEDVMNVFFADLGDNLSVYIFSYIDTVRPEERIACIFSSKDPLVDIEISDANVDKNLLQILFDSIREKQPKLDPADVLKILQN